jgi:hypothetical protein
MMNTEASMKVELTLVEQKQVEHGKAFARMIAKAMKEAGVTGVRIKNRGIENRCFSASIKSDQMLDVLIFCRTESFIVRGQLETDAVGTIVLDFATSKHAKPTNNVLWNAMKTRIREVLYKKFKHTRDFSSPWHFKDHSRTTLGGEMYRIGHIETKPYEEPRTTAPKYDPQAEYLNRRTPAAQARAARIADSQFASDFGGCASNYRF